jgi:DnaJ-class molecular chaperone
MRVGESHYSIAPTEAATDECKRINEAYEILSNPNLRKRIDETGETQDRREHNPAETMVAAMLADAFAQDRVDTISWIKDRLAATRADHHVHRDKLIVG